MAENWNNKLPDEAFLIETDKPYEKEAEKNSSLKAFYKNLKPGNT